VKIKLGRVIVAIELVRNEGERAFTYTWEDKTTPLGSFTSVKSYARVSISRRGVQLQGFGCGLMRWHEVASECLVKGVSWKV
jgi:hypothetical protein